MFSHTQLTITFGYFLILLWRSDNVFAASIGGSGRATVAESRTSLLNQAPWVHYSSADRE